MAASGEVETTVEGRVAIVHLNREARRNALDGTHLHSLCRTLTELSRDNVIRVVIISGRGSAFCAGVDIRELSQQTPESARNTQFLQSLSDAFNTLRHKVVLAAVNGAAIGGGCELALMCDIAYASTAAYFALPEITLGTIPGVGGTQRLMKLVGKPKCMQMILCAERWNAQKALQEGIVADVFEHEHLLSNVIQKAHDIANRPPLAVAFAKEAMEYGKSKKKKKIACAFT